MAGSTLNQEGSEPAQRDEQTAIDRYWGTAVAIVATKLIRLDQLPGQPGRDPVRMFYRRGEPAEAVHRLDSQADPENWIRVDRMKADLYCLTAGISREDSLLRRAATRARRARESAEFHAETHKREGAAKEKRRLDAERELASMPTCKEDFLRELTERLRWDIEWGLDYHSANRKRERYHGYMLTARAVTEISRALLAAFEEAISRADVIFDQAMHQEIIGKRRREIASLDDSFQRHLTLIATTGKARQRPGEGARVSGLRVVRSTSQSAPK